MSGFRTTKTPGVLVRHRQGCPAAERDGSRCRCQPSYRGRRRNPVTGRPEWSLSLKDRAEVLTWLAAGEKGADALAERELAGQTFAELASQWWQGVQAGSIGKRKGRSGSAYSTNTLKGYERSLHRVLL